MRLNSKLIARYAYCLTPQCGIVAVSKAICQEGSSLAP